MPYQTPAPSANPGLSKTNALERYDWLISQHRWHQKRAGEKRGWHWKQAQFYLRQSYKIPGLFALIVARAFRENTSRLTANVTKNNVLFHRLKSNVRE